jgi:chorismate lyase / 3-hydroxybenzoate synthase
MTTAAPYCVELRPAAELASLRDDPGVFATIAYGQTTTIDPQWPGRIQIALPPQEGQELIEVWRTQLTLQQDSFGPVRYQYCDQFLFGSLLIEDTAFPDLAQASAYVYQQIHDCLEASGFPALLRMWNYFPRINIEVEGLERYRSFCIGRHQALDEWHFPEEQLPAATAIGTLGEGLLVYFVASKKPGMQIENPRQVSAFHYPEQYGPRSPTFSRATMMDWQQLYISGTASIVGHETRHHHNSIAQLEETLNNLRIVVEQAHQKHGLACNSLKDLNLVRLYVRNPDDSNLLRSHLAQQLGDRPQIQVLHGDICRSDLLLEIEAMYAPC